MLIPLIAYGVGLVGMVVLVSACSKDKPDSIPFGDNCTLDCYISNPLKSCQEVKIENWNQSKPWQNSVYACSNDYVSHMTCFNWEDEYVPNGEAHKCEEGYNCEGGECVDENGNVQESDPMPEGGYRASRTDIGCPYKYGALVLVENETGEVVPSTEVWDKCISPSTLQYAVSENEYYTDVALYHQDITFKDYDCNNGCKNGRCLKN